VYPHQSERLTAALEREGLAALVATSAANVFYLTDFRRFGPETVGAEPFAVFASRGVALVLPAMDVPHVVTEGIEADHLVAFGDCGGSYAATLSSSEGRIRDVLERRVPSPGQALAVALAALGVGGGAIGLDESRLTPSAWERLGGELGGFALKPGAAALLGARRVKSPYEIESLARALAIAEEALNAVLQMLEPGVTERESAAVFEREVLKREGAPCPSAIAFGARTWLPFARPTEHALKPGDLVRFDVAVRFKGYGGSVARTAVMGEPTDAQAAAVEAVQAAVEAGIYAVKPGATGGAVHDAVTAAARAKLPDFRADHVGHGVGLESRETPALSAADTTELEPGEVVTVDVAHLEIGGIGVALRDTVLVTTTDSRVLNRSLRGLIVLD
jgi:Xaa-Pro aminopeptidase